MIHPEAGGEVPDAPVTGPQMDPHENDEPPPVRVPAGVAAS
jgi:hypothetical protein